ncbi:MAG: PEP-CTERM sorting domain-containing protein [Prevotella sp.]|nr:PEP-CTERM sorting domain-containing protein [Prevotella sp.]
MATIAMAAIIANAATVTWNMTNVYGPDGSTLNSGKAYMFAYTAGSDSVTASTIAAAIAGAYSSGTLDSYLNDNSVYSWTPASAGTYSDTTKNVDPEADMGLTAGSSYTFYSVVFDSNTIDDESMFFVTKELANKKVPASSANLLLSFGTQATASTAEGAWQAVPEPTSGLLLLLGVAGLALRRKRA